ncbi:DNA repair protein RecN [Mycoplasmatota bacterium]|nr:DNA repair protein RecN [Mycoplasmatota bacterium]
MIRKLNVQNFALIDDLEMTFEEGLTALTGETGAGKSIILESLHLLFGKRSDAQMIRYGEDRAIVKGLFDIPLEVADFYGYPKTIDIERQIDAQGRHQIRINQEVVTLSKLRELTKMFASIHGQDETMLLLDKKSYLQYIDQVDEEKINELHQKYMLLRSDYLAKKKAFDTLKNKKQESVERSDFLSFQIKELESYNLEKNEKETLLFEINKLENYDKTMAQLQLAYQLLSGQTFDLDALYESSKHLKQLISIDITYEEMQQRLESSYYEIDDVKSKIFDLIESLDFDQEAFNQMQERSFELQKIEQKYQKSIDELIDYLEDIKDELLRNTNYDQYVIESKKKVQDAFDKTYNQAIKLTQYRKKLAKGLSEQLLLELKELDLDKASFDVLFECPSKDEAQFLETGIEQVEFMISLNEGEPVKPLAKVASGGERARFMFALKSIYAKANHLSLLILDEIDIGISGKTAAKVAFKMTELSKDMQLIVISHLPQVAAKANYHYGISKHKEKERMVTRIHLLSMEERISNIAMMLSDEKLSHYAIGQAKILLGLE